MENIRTRANPDAGGGCTIATTVKTETDSRGSARRIRSFVVHEFLQPFGCRSECSPRCGEEKGGGGY